MSLLACKVIILLKKMVECGIKTKLIMGPSQIKIEDNINTVKVTTAQEMLEAVKESLPTDIAVCSAAVSDFRTDKFEQKNKKNNKRFKFKTISKYGHTKLYKQSQ